MYSYFVNRFKTSYSNEKCMCLKSSKTDTITYHIINYILSMKNTKITIVCTW